MAIGPDDKIDSRYCTMLMPRYRLLSLLDAFARRMLLLITTRSSACYNCAPLPLPRDAATQFMDAAAQLCRWAAGALGGLWDERGGSNVRAPRTAALHLSLPAAAC